MGENLSFKSSSDFFNDENITGSSPKSKQTTPPSECYYYLVKPNFTSNNSKDETFEINQLKSLSSSKINFEPITDQSDNDLKNFLENCFNELSKNNTIECSNSTILENSSNTSSISNNTTSPIISLTNNVMSSNQLKSMDNADTPRLSLVRKQKTIVEKIPDSNNSSLPTNTFLLNGENLNDLNDFYSLKITFV